MEDKTYPQTSGVLGSNVMSLSKPKNPPKIKQNIQRKDITYFSLS